MKKVISIIAILILTGCEYRPMEVHEIKTESGQVIKLKCPMFKDGERGSPFVISDSLCYLTN